MQKRDTPVNVFRFRLFRDIFYLFLRPVFLKDRAERRKSLFRAIGFQDFEILADLFGKLVAEVIVVIFPDFFRLRRPALFIDVQELIERFFRDVRILNIDIFRIGKIACLLYTSPSPRDTT